MSQPSTAVNTVKLIEFDPNDPEADVEGWCNVTEIIVQEKRLEGVELLIALTKALKGHAATFLTKINLQELKWSTVKDTLLARFAKPKFIQDHFDDILKFQIGSKETAPESALRLWNLIERIPKVEFPEEVITGFVISVLCQKDYVIRRELTTHVIATRAQLFRVLGGISLKRRSDVNNGNQEPDVKRSRIDSKFPGKCHWCGVSGHRQADCRKRKEDINTAKIQDQSSSTSTRGQDNLTVCCYTCGKRGHVSTACPEKKMKDGIERREVNLCGHRLSRSTLETSTGERFPFLFDSGSSCSLLTESIRDRFPGIVRNNTVYLTGIGGDEVQCTSQILSTVKINDISVDLVFHVIPDSVISVPVIVGRDILNEGFCVTIDDDKLIFRTKERANFCEKKKVGLLNDNEAETAAEDAQHSQINSYVESPPNQNDRSDNLDIRDEIVGADSDTASANSATLTAGSDTLSVYSDPETLDVQCEVETYSQPDGS
ncbi:polyprotein [Danaus plexippus plexippus]|uniref:Polyprotein n=1 Tax=Danaus plexippus plexippus TaxID=278856 RepID=A0A212FFF0_DANPL|nr:polyprotein [Danaus plexippus plexippus]